MPAHVPQSKVNWRRVERSFPQTRAETRVEFERQPHALPGTVVEGEKIICVF